MKDKHFYEQIGIRIQRERERSHLTREKLAEMIDISSKFLYEIETGKKGFSCEILYRICRMLRVNADSMLGLEARNMQDLKIEYMLNRFSQEDLIQIEQVISAIYNLQNR